MSCMQPCRSTGITLYLDVTRSDANPLDTKKNKQTEYPKNQIFERKLKFS